MVIRLKLTRYQQILAKSIGRTRSDAKPDGVRDESPYYYREKDDPAYPHIIGATGEIAYARVIGGEIDMRIMSKGDQYDFPGGIEVKTSTWEGDDIELKAQVRLYEKKVPNKYVLVRVYKDLTTAEILGEITRKQFDRVKTKKNYGHEDNWIVGLKDLSPVEWNRSLWNQVCEADYAWLNIENGYDAPEHRRFMDLHKKWLDSNEFKKIKKVEAAEVKAKKETAEKYGGLSL